MAEAKLLMYPNALVNIDNGRVRVTSRSSIMSCIKDIIEIFLEDPDKPSRFKRRQLKMFEDSCFGTLYLGMHEVISSGGIVHDMIVRQADSISDDVIEFNFNGKGKMFTKRKFGFITGLKMENSLDVPPPPHSNRIRNKYFGHLKKIKNSDVRDVYVNLKRKKLDDKDDMVRLALIYFLECALIEYNWPDTNDNMAMDEDGEIRDHEMTVVHDSDVQFITPSKVVHREPRIKRRADRLKSPFVVTAETRDALKSTLPPPMDFDPKRATPEDISKNFFEYFFSDI
ncbi:hypothetical protein FNV43_RR01985 [Rhamnella rubrinervis]|uniref:DUF1985 domain-containing protein n=1 Tax=Rhamnella rubrinervis TaxID=2594499 RepID=A0A8K0MTG2_9ROSA|nr:hypothetical protein FNV43_RR01985 [Rhamnella rubrinervis]